jgi:hypothetical protein
MMTFRILILAVLAMASGCQTLGLTPAKTYNQKFAYAVGIHKAVLQTIDDSVNGGSLSSADARALLKQADNARGLLDAAQTANSLGDKTGAQNNLTLATTALTALQAYLNAHQTNPATPLPKPSALPGVAPWTLINTTFFQGVNP